MERAAKPAVLIVTMCVAEAIGMLGFGTFPALLPGFMGEWGLSNTEAGWINGIYYAGYLSAVPVLVSLTDRVAARRVYYLCMALNLIAYLGFALAAQGFWTALVFRALAGIGLAGTYMPGLKFISDRLEGPGQGRAVAFYTSSFGIGAALSFLMAGAVDALLGWQWAFALAAIGPAVAVALVALLLPGGDPEPVTTPDTHLLDFRPVLTCRPAMGYVLAYTAHNFELFAFRSWIVAYLVFAEGLGTGGELILSATVLAALFNLMGVPSSVLGNELATRFGRHRVITVVMLTSALVACLFGIAATWPLWLVAVLCVGYAVTVTGDSASITAGVIAAAPEGYRGATMAVHSCIGFSGSFAGPLVFGVVLDLAGGQSVLSWGLAFVTAGAAAALGPAALAVLRVRERAGA